MLHISYGGFNLLMQIQFKFLCISDKKVFRDIAVPGFSVRSDVQATDRNI